MHNEAQRLLIRSFFLCGSLIVPSLIARSARPEPAELPTAQSELARQYERLEATAARLAELSEASDPGRAHQLREAIRVGREQDIQTRFDSIIELLQEERLAAAARNQQELARQLEGLLDVLLSKPTDRRSDTEAATLRKQVRDLGRLIRAQRSLRARTESAPQIADLVPQQDELAEKASEVEAALEPKSEKMPSESAKSSESPSSEKALESSEVQTDDPNDEVHQPGELSPSDQAAQRVAEAQKAMQKAQENMEEEDRKEASAEQIAAQRALEQARKELERRLRQLREEEMQRTLLQLAARFRQMLEIQQQILGETEGLARAYGKRVVRELEIKAATLAKRELQLSRDADRAMLLLREDGTSVAFPEALEQIRADMMETTGLLHEAKVGTLTQGIEKDIVFALQEAVEAMEEAAEDLANRQEQHQQPSGLPTGGQSGEPPLVAKLAELRMIRSLQLRINRRTADLGKIAERGDVQTAEIQPMLKRLATRQAKVAQAARDLHFGRND